MEQGLSMNLHSTTRHLNHALKFKSAENVRSSNVVEFEFELVTSLSHIIVIIGGGIWCFYKLTVEFQ